MSRIFHRKIWYYAICGVFSLIIAFAVFSGTASAQASSRAEHTIGPVGTWNVTINVIAGLTPGQQEQGVFTFTSHRTLSSVVGGLPGTGTWEPTSPTSFSFQVHVRIVVNGQLSATAHVIAEATLTNNGNGFKAYGMSTETDLNGNVTLGNMGIFTATRA